MKINGITIKFGIDTSDYGASGPAGYYLSVFAVLDTQYGWAHKVPLPEVPPQLLAMDLETFLSDPWVEPLVQEAVANLLPHLDAQVVTLTAAIAGIRAELPAAS